MKKSLLIGAAALGAMTFAGGAGSVSASADTQVPLYRTYNPNSGEHFYTTSYDEALNAYNAGWNIEGVGWQTPSSGSAVYRVFNPNSKNAGSHYYTANKSEADHLVGLGWKWDNNGQPVFYSGGQFSVYVQYNKNNSGHNYTTSLNEQNSVVAAGWEANNVTIYASGEGNQSGAKDHNGNSAPVNPSSPAIMDWAKQYYTDEVNAAMVKAGWGDWATNPLKYYVAGSVLNADGSVTMPADPGAGVGPVTYPPMGSPVPNASPAGVYGPSKHSTTLH